MRCVPINTAVWRHQGDVSLVGMGMRPPLVCLYFYVVWVALFGSLFARLLLCLASACCVWCVIVR